MTSKRGFCCKKMSTCGPNVAHEQNYEEEENVSFVAGMLGHLYDNRGGPDCCGLPTYARAAGSATSTKEQLTVILLSVLPSKG